MNDATEILYGTCSSGTPDMVQYALGSGPDVNSEEWANGFTPLHVCVTHGDGRGRQEIIKMLHRAGADLESRDSTNGLTPLQWAGMRNRPYCAEALIQCGADIHAAEANGATALHGAAHSGNLDVARVLLKAGADANRKDNWGNTPVSLARSGGHAALVDLLTGKGDSGSSPPSTDQCPRGHGALRAWGGTLRCWTCGYPTK